MVINYVICVTDPLAQLRAVRRSQIAASRGHLAGKDATYLFVLDDYLGVYIESNQMVQYVKGKDNERC